MQSLTVKKTVTNVAASVHARLLAATKRRGGDFNLTLQRYAAERFLYRLGASRFREAFVLKGAMLFVLWGEAFARPTRDLDLAGYWENDPDSLMQTLREVCSTQGPPDGLEFRLDALAIERIGGVAEPHGYRAHLEIGLGQAVIRLQVDIGFGDVVVPAPLDVVFPALLDVDAPSIRAYPREAVVAEKFHAMVLHGQANSRYKDFLDVHVLSQRFPFGGPTLAASISATFARRGSATLTPWPVALTSGFYADVSRSDQWLRYIKRSKLTEAPRAFVDVGDRIIAFLEAVVRALSAGESFEAVWAPDGPWR
jgi:Nucleotidyl transferase AbiEii toxin, Type IV TA system